MATFVGVLSRVLAPDHPAKVRLGLKHGKKKKKNRFLNKLIRSLKFLQFFYYENPAGPKNVQIDLEKQHCTIEILTKILQEPVIHNYTFSHSHAPELVKWPAEIAAKCAPFALLRHRSPEVHFLSAIRRKKLYQDMHASMPLWLSNRRAWKGKKLRWLQSRRALFFLLYLSYHRTIYPVSDLAHWCPFVFVGA